VPEGDDVIRKKEEKETEGGRRGQRVKGGQGEGGHGVFSGCVGVTMGSVSRSSWVRNARAREGEATRSGAGLDFRFPRKKARLRRARWGGGCRR